MWAFTAIFRQLFFRDFPYFIQRSALIKIEYFCIVSPVKALNESILHRLTQLDKLQSYYSLSDHSASTREINYGLLL